MTDAPDIDGTVPPRPRPGSQEARLAGFNLLRRLLIYHLALAAALAVLLALVPSLPAHLPIGGVEVLAEGTGLVGPEPPVLSGPGNLGHARQAPAHQARRPAAAHGAVPARRCRDAAR